MKTGERVVLIKRLAHKLGEEDWTEIDLTLRQFELPWLDDFKGPDTYQYALNMLEEASDEKLLELQAYLLHVPEGQGDADQGADLWRPGKLRAFCSHVSAYKELVSNVKLQLGEYHIDCFVAHEDITPSKHWQEEIKSALISCHVLLAFLTDGFHESNWTDQEVGFCVARGIPILPIKCGIDPYGFISSIQAVPAGDCEPSRIAAAVAGILTSHPAIRSAMIDALVHGFVTSSSWESAKQGIALLSKLPHISDEDLQRIEDAVQTNTQISDAFGVPAKVQSLLARHRKRGESTDA